MENREQFQHTTGTSTAQSHSSATAYVFQPNAHWTESLPLILLGMRNALKTDAGCNPAELVYGTLLRIPGEFVSPSSFPPALDHATSISSLTNAMRSVKPAPVRPQSIDVFVHPYFKTSHVFVRRNSVHLLLEPPYDGPYKVTERMDKFLSMTKKAAKTLLAATV
ncbi:unnamed protein product [Trichobilharzia regenti]|nr:unnamed protein product [Trichobilharzia regenti]